MKIILDAEFDSLTPTKIWCIVCKELDDSKEKVFYGPKIFDEFAAYANNVSCFIGHNVISFDSYHINKLSGQTLIDPHKCIDTLVTSRLIHYKKPGGHSVRNWGEKFGLTKKFIDVYDDPSRIKEYIERCVYDVRIQYKIFKSLERFIFDKAWSKALRMEHELEIICGEMHENGFGFDIGKAKSILKDISAEMEELENKIKEQVPPILKEDGEIILRLKKDGTPTKKTLETLPSDYGDFNHGDVFMRTHYEPFNPRSAKDRIELLHKFGWKPTDKTKGHILCERKIRDLQRRIKSFKIDESPRKKKLEEELEKHSLRLEKFKVTGWKVNETNLDTLPAKAPDEVRLLATWLCLEGRRGDLEEWIAAYNVYSGRIHGRFNGIGSWTHRMSHVQPNQGNIFRSFDLGECKDNENPTPVEDVKVRFNGVLRSLWRVEPGNFQLGTDAEGIQMRILAHYINDPELTRAIEEGKKEDGSDVHSFNRKVLGEICRSRDDAKTFIYAWVLGAGDGKVAEILGCSFQDARAAMGVFLSRIPGLGKLKRRTIPSDARRGYFDGLDGRKVVCNSEHLMLAGYLQNGEKVIMGHANILWRKWLEEEGIRYKQIDFVHDEWQTELYTEEEAHRAGELQCLAVVRTGEELGLNCKLAGEYKIGTNWLETH